MTSASLDRRSLGALVVGAALAPSWARARQTAQSPEQLLRIRVDAQKAGTSAALAIVSRQQPVKLVNHWREGGRAVALDRPFQIASLTKTFTALLLADAVRRGEVNLEDPLSRHLDGAALARDGRSVTLLDLATHTSGLPLRPPSRADRDQTDPYGGYSEQDLRSDLAAVRLESVPGTSFRYSNFGFALLGAALAQRAGRTYSALLQARILDPLGLRDTSLVLDAHRRARLLPGSDVEGRPAKPWDMGALAPAGGLFSTLADLARYARLWIDRRGPLAEAARLMLRPVRPGDDASTRMGLGWRVSGPSDSPRYWSNGTGGGVRSILAIRPSTGMAVAGLIDRVSAVGVDDIAMHVLDPTVRVDIEVVPERKAIPVAGEVLDRHAGVYAFAPDDTLTLVKTEAGLAIVLGSSRIPLSAESETQFFIPGANITLEFEAPAGGRSPAVVLKQSGETFRYVRTD